MEEATYLHGWMVGFGTAMMWALPGFHARNLWQACMLALGMLVLVVYWHIGTLPPPGFSSWMAGVSLAFGVAAWLGLVITTLEVAYMLLVRWMAHWEQ